MARPGISYNDVKQAALSLLSRGEAPSIQRVRQHLGTGSNSTIAEHLRRWQAERGEREDAPLPPTVPEDLMPAVEQFWQSAREQAEAAYLAYRQQAEQQVSEAQGRQDALLRERDTARRLAEELRDTLQALRSDLRQRDDQLAGEREQRIRWESAVEAAGQRLEEARQRLDTQAQDFQARLDSEKARQQQQAQEHDKALQASEARLDLERERGEATENRLLLIIDQLRAQQAQLQDALQKTNDEARTRERTWQNQQDILQRQVAGLEAREQELSRERERLEEQLARADARYLDDVRLVEQLRAKLRATGLARKRLEAHLLAVGIPPTNRRD